MKQWQAKSTSRKGTDACRASCAVPVKCLPEDCPRSKWLVDNGNGKWGPQQTVTISVQQDNNGAAVSADDFDDEKAKLIAEVIKFDTGIAVAHSAGVGKAGRFASSVRIVGATGPNAGAINGMYKPTEELSGGMPLYVKVGNPDKWLGYYAPMNQWQMINTAAKGTGNAAACCAGPVGCSPEGCPRGRWHVFDGSEWVLQPAITISVVTLDEVDAHRAQVEEEAARVVKGSHNVRITGATGTHAGRINGMYRPTQELSGNVAMYVKVDDGEWWLQYRAGTMKWQVTSTAGKGTDKSLAYCAVPAKCLPDDCPRGNWQVIDDDKLFRPQPAVTVKQKKRER